MQICIGWYTLIKQSVGQRGSLKLLTALLEYINNVIFQWEFTLDINILIYDTGMLLVYTEC